MATFDGVTFSERGQGGRLAPLHGAAVSYVVHRVPYGGYHVQVMSRAPEQRFEMPAQMGSAVLSSLKGKAAPPVFDSLVYSGGTVDATLLEVRDVVEVSPDYDVYQATLVFGTEQY